MIKYIASASAALAFAVSATFAVADESVTTAGQIDFNGVVSAPGCSIAANDQKQTIDLKEWTVKQIIDDSVVPEPVSIAMRGCSAGTFGTDTAGGQYNALKVVFTGAKVNGNNAIYENTAGDKPASGVGVSLLSRDQKVIEEDHIFSSNGTADSELVIADDGASATFHLFAKMVKIDGQAVRAGNVSASVNFQVFYE